ncbi:restriction endonuclease subunit R [Komarekiella sp. 'clone 1']|uniref:Restriction endonuclease subunit R n=1 Tax=Komarekiella delphini-convector SJRDD-AB1 TaxID=2593771 RepID=A0AA40VPZ6_9NOST|nr:type I restriction endonuclease [Komarekiella delphini-convector]MBD6615242.1 restriction endonuclease subunit R [Komarekiella delphini-convector SJRDD-AB1]
MIQVIQAQNVTLNYFKEKFALHKSENEQFFTEWFDYLPTISELEKQYLDRVKINYLSVLESAPLLEEAVKLVVLSPLLDLAGFYRYPFHIATEETIEISEEIIIYNEEKPEETKEVIKGKIDVLILQNQLWLLVIESKRSSFSLAKAIPQALTYMLANPKPDYPAYSLVMNGEDFQFMKLIKQEQPIYGLSDRFTLYRRENELYKVLDILKNLGQVLS